MVGTAVTVLPWHNPVLLAEEVATLDLLSDGRLDFGVGKGYRDIEFKGFCVPKEEAQERYEEALEIMFKAWQSTERFSYHSDRWNFEDIVVEPEVVQKPYPPIWIGGQSKPAIRRAAQIGDAWHPVGAIPAAPLEPEELAENLVLLRDYAEKAGRDPSKIQVSVKAPLYDANSSGDIRRRFSGSADEVRQDVQTYADVGVTHLIFDFRTADPNQTEDRMARFSEEVMAVT